jgi:hypothetical protein
MKNVIKLLSILLLIQLTGCIVFHSVSYEVNVNDDGTGTALVTIEDINSDATTKENLDEDVKSILEYGLKSQEFVNDQKTEGKNITTRNLVVERGKLNAIVRYEFSDISKVEGIQFDAPYYYLTMPAEDSIISTNGQVTVSKDYKRIVWDNSIKVLKFKMFVADTESGSLKSMAEFHKDFMSRFGDIEKSDHKDFMGHFGDIEKSGLQSLKNLDNAINNSSQISGTMNKYTVGQTALSCFDVFNGIWKEYDALSIPINFPESIRNRLFSAKEKMSTTYYKRTQAISDLVEYLNYGEEDYAESFKNKMNSAQSYYALAKEDFSLAEKEIKKIGDINLPINQIINVQNTERIDSINNDMEYNVFFLTKDGVSIFNTKSKEISLLIKCPNNYVISSQASLPSKKKIAFAIIDNLDNTRIYVIDLGTKKYHYLKNNSGIKPINLVWKDENNLFINTYTEKYEDGIYKPQNPWTELIDVKNNKVIYSFRPTSGSVLSDYLSDKNYLVYYSLSTSFSSENMKVYYIINPANNKQMESGFGFNFNTQVKFFNDKKLFTWSPVNTTDEYGRILSTEYKLTYRYYDDDYSSVTVFDLKDNPRELTYYPQINKIICVIKYGTVSVYSLENNTSTFINITDNSKSIKLSPTGNILLYYDMNKKMIVVKNLLNDQTYNINYPSLLEEWSEDNSILLSSDINKNFRLYNILSKTYLEFSLSDLNGSGWILGYAQQ